MTLTAHLCVRGDHPQETDDAFDRGFTSGSVIYIEITLGYAIDSFKAGNQ